MKWKNVALRKKKLYWLEKTSIMEEGVKHCTDRGKENHARGRKKKKKKLHWPGIEPGPPAWQARILPLNHQCYAEVLPYSEHYMMDNLVYVYAAVVRVQSLIFLRTRTFGRCIHLTELRKKHKLPRTLDCTLVSMDGKPVCYPELYIAPYWCALLQPFSI